MLDEKSIDVISRFKLALLTRSQNPARNDTLPLSNRGRKLPSAESNPQALTPKIVEYDGSHHLVLTNDVIERTNYTNKRRWKDFYRLEKRLSGVLLDSDSGNTDSESDSELEDNPLKKIRLSEILAPIAHPSELATHPAILKTYKLTNLSVLAAELIETIEVEQHTLNQYNKLLQVLDGEDWYYQLEENMELPAYDHGLDDSLVEPAESENSKETNATSEDKENPEKHDPPALAAEPPADAEETEFANKRITRAAVQPEDAGEVTDPFFALPKSLALFEQQQRRQREEIPDEDEFAAVQLELVNYLQVSIQRQHEYIKNLSTIRAGLVKADRYKRDLLRWGKDMSEKKH